MAYLDYFQNLFEENRLLGAPACAKSSLSTAPTSPPSASTSARDPHELALDQEGRPALQNFCML